MTRLFAFSLGATALLACLIAFQMWTPLPASAQAQDAPPLVLDGGASAPPSGAGAITPTPRTAGISRNSRPGGPLVVASLGSTQLTRIQLARMIRPMMQTVLLRNDIDPHTNSDEYYKIRRLVEEEVVTQWLLTKALVHEARKAGQLVTKAEVDLAMMEANEQLEEMQEDTATTVSAERFIPDTEDMREALHDALLIKKVLRKWIESNIPERDLREIFQREPASYGYLARERQYQQIVLVQQPGMQPDELRDKMRDVLARARRGADFVMLAREAGMDSDIPVTRTMLENDYLPNETLYDAIWKTPVGEVHNQVIPVRVGVQIIKVLSETPARAISFEEARENIINTIIENSRDQTAIEALRAQRSQVQVHFEYLTPIEVSEEERIESIKLYLTRTRQQRARGATGATVPSALESAGGLSQYQTGGGQPSPADTLEAARERYRRLQEMRGVPRN